ncbi:MAG: helix-turn-helix domain-containing protein [Oscillospiraceae bacterium]|jgi:AraC-like DNA-binding protein|nr:helix-turn-helix domain-containing protein [Oscillospiraceae bacterium]
MDLVQPFFPVNTSRYYKTTAPGYPIAHFYTYQADAAQMRRTHVIPDGCVDLLFELRDGQAEGWAYGTVTRHWELPAAAGCVWFGVRFQPGWLPAALSVSCAELVNTRTPLRDCKGGAALCEQVAAKGFRERIGLVLRYAEDMRGPGEPLQSMLTLIERHTGNVRVGQLEAETHYSSRYIHQLFRRQLGISTKSFVDFMRFQLAVIRLNAQPGKNMAELAVEAGYFDQSHLVKAFRAFADFTPGGYAAAVDLPNYYRKIVQV